ncbi:enoyl-CoA hydratase/isomerase family protein [Gordonia liuliyuniae]|uniref:Enoyl-CoA hydratase/isomerase family protein n=1 Tax=Gordonia liuliyuniae TaxID=2911517 RepID=A0ABS9IWT1_9ACTN|nr:enoyl-CoA hydratase/isomerase family protein [Gordonia liuliyuniae]MCF8589932.1 enoyl-CoA hydratase/isomerase family protein [Gordonia liuliyuniae]
MSDERLAVETLDDRVVITLDRPATRNAIDAEMVAELHVVCDQVEKDPKPLLVTGGTEIFAGGADIGQLRERRNVDALAGVNSRVFDRIAALPMPTVAAVAGFALGGGAELAYACDFRIGTPSVRLGNPEGGLGILAAAGASWRLTELVGEPLAKEILLAGRTLNASEALDVRLLNEVVEPDDLLPTANRWIDRMLQNAPLALRMTKLALRMPRSAHPAFDNVAQAVLFETDEKHRRMTAFLDRKSSEALRLAAGRE